MRDTFGNIAGASLSPSLAAASGVWSLREQARLRQIGAWPVANTITGVAVLLTAGTTYTVPTGAVLMKAWAVGGGGGSTLSWAWNNASQGGGVAYKTWQVSAGQTVTYSAGAAGAAGNGNNSTVTFGGVTITGYGGVSSYYFSRGCYGGFFTGGDGGAMGGYPDNSLGSSNAARGGAVGGNAASVATCGRRPMSDVSGLKAALTLAGATVNETCATTAAFGSGGYAGKFISAVSPGIGGGHGGGGTWTSTGGAVLLYFT